MGILSNDGKRRVRDWTGYRPGCSSFELVAEDLPNYDISSLADTFVGADQAHAVLGEDRIRRVHGLEILDLAARRHDPLHGGLALLDAFALRLRRETGVTQYRGHVG